MASDGIYDESRPQGIDVLRQCGIVLDQAAERAAARQVKNLAKDPEAKLAVLHSCYKYDAHIAPYGETGKRFKAAVEYMEVQYGISMVPRTMQEKVKDLLDKHITSENKQDGETGTEHDLTPVEVSP